ncbi:MAG: DedA family protein [Gammaproteobacteria bacterium]|nr:DedA family protein [Gammaproteobacteria bacterium]
MTDNAGLLGLFGSALLSSTLFPGGSEAVLVWMAVHATHPVWLLWLVATAGNTLGGISTWWVGHWVARRWGQPQWLQAPRYQQALQRVSRWGGVTLLLSWLPVIGDPLCLAAGWLQVRWLPALLFILAGKGLRYAALLAASAALVH